MVWHIIITALAAYVVWSTFRDVGVQHDAPTPLTRRGAWLRAGFYGVLVAISWLAWVF